MSGDRYPILVERLTGKRALLIACLSCDAETTIGAEDIRNDMNYSCPKGCGGWAVYKYAEADKCPNCDRLGWYSGNGLEDCCSRPCQLQAEYAKSLAARAAA